MSSSVLVEPLVGESFETRVDRARREWALVAPRLATAVVRQATWFKASKQFKYLTKSETLVTAERPMAPAAVRIYTDEGFTRCFVADFDSHNHSVALVRKEAHQFARLLDSMECQYFIDESPTGGRHIYIPLQDEVPFAEASGLAGALARKFQTFDHKPMMNVASGIIRPPGSTHPRGMFQRLVSSEAQVEQALQERTGPRRWRNLVAAVGLARPHTGTFTGSQAETIAAAFDQPALKSRPYPLFPDVQQVASTGRWDSRKHASASEARLGLLRAIARAGYTFADVNARMEDGTWAGLAGFYTKYPEGPARLERMATEWLKASTYRSPRGHMPKSDTSISLTQGAPPAHNQTQPSTRATVLAWLSAITLLEKTRWPGRPGLAVRRVLRALAFAALVKGADLVEFGVRSLAEGSGLDHSTVAAVLEMLRTEPEPVLELVSPASGLAADQYLLTFPEGWRELGAARKGPDYVLAIHPAMRALPAGAFLLWEILARTNESVSAFDLSSVTGLSLRAVHATLRAMSEAGLVESTHDGWKAVGNLDEYAEDSGALATHTQIRQTHQRERAAWREFVLFLAVMRDNGFPVGGEVVEQIPKDVYTSG